MEDVEGVKLVFSFSIFFYLIAKLYNFFFLCYNNTILKKIIYSEPERLKECNLLALNTFKVKKADKAEVLSYSKLINITEGCTKISGDIYDKAVYLLKEIIQKHPFASGNKRTACVVTKEFLLNNKTEFVISKNPEHSRVMIGIRENYYTDSEIKTWIKNGTIREFKR